LLESDPAWSVFCSEFRRFLGEEKTQEEAGEGVESGLGHQQHLTRRELEVLKLIAEGNTDAKIAAALHLSIRTVGNHVKNILAKTASANRTMAAMYAAKRDLL
jgi:DNA-binding NarL/FixJ family response regulator